jgi:hypothetical protein
MKKLMASITGATVALACLSLAPSVADAHVRHQCDMTGTWLDTGETWLFVADYWMNDNGSDTFSGIWANPAAGATANVKGAAVGGTWDIKFNYSDPAHAGWVRHLVGNGTFNRTTRNITVNGTQTLKRSGVKTGGGTFSMTGKCRAM